jgi:regulator of replication initiation timing
MSSIEEYQLLEKSNKDLQSDLVAAIKKIQILERQLVDVKLNAEDNGNKEEEIEELTLENAALRSRISQMEVENSALQQVNNTLRSMMSFMEVCKNGTLLIYDMKRKYQPRWFTLKGQILSMYKDELDNKLLSSIDVTGARVYQIPSSDDPKVLEKEELIFELVLNGGQTNYTFAATSLNEKKAWCDAIVHASKSAQRRESEC